MHCKVACALFTLVFAVSAAHTRAGQQTPSPAGKADPAAPVVWTSDPALAGALGPDVKLLAYTMRVPTGYSEASPTVDIQELRKNGVDTHTYNRERLPDGSAPSFGVTIATLPAKYVGKVAVADALMHIVAQKKDAWQGFSQSKPERGLIGGVDFLRTYYKGVIAGPKGKVNVQGFAYASVNDKYIIGIEAEDTAEHYQTTRPIIEAAVMTFHKQ